MSKSEYFKEKIIDEFQYNIKKINECDNVSDALFYFSALPAIITRVFNFEFDRYLLFIQFVLANTQSTITRVSQIDLSGPPIITMDFFKELAEILQELMDTIKENNKAYEILEKIVMHVYTLTGNGRYLKEKGTIKI